MIESITISGIATYPITTDKVSELSRFNFFFGANGAGKTTVSRLIADETAFPTCNVAWKAGTKLQPMVYNHDFVEANFNQSDELKGVFTLGEKQVDTLEKIAVARRDSDALTKKLEAIKQSLQGMDGNGGKKRDLEVLEVDFKEKCWILKRKYDATLRGGLEGYRNSAENFKVKILHEQDRNNAALFTFSELEKRAASVFGAAPTKENLITVLDAKRLASYEGAPVLKKRVIGKDDVDIAAIINKLENSDWVKEGLAYYEINNGICPFCQQETSGAFAKSLGEYFDDAFMVDTRAIEHLVSNYATEASNIKQEISNIIESPNRFLDVDKIKQEKEIFDAKVMLNNQRLDGKKKEASQIVELEPLNSTLIAINDLIEKANLEVNAHNSMVANLAAERSKLTSEVWRFVLEEAKADLAAFNVAKEGLEKAIAAMKAQLAATTLEMAAKASEIRELERQTTSVQPTIDSINVLLSSFGFQGFKLAKAASETSYKLVRVDGSSAKATLSEGEKTFITFLYFYHLLKGSNSESGITINRVVVFDDPVSSLDSDILFIVGSLIKALFEEVRTEKGQIKQVFVLTHNVYFHKEVTYNSKRRKFALSEETFWIVRKPGLLSRIDKHPTNPIKTSYELLWTEVRNPDRSNVSIQNTLRRILENYFKILGGIEFDGLCEMFEGKEKIICKSLCSWVHDGSHYAHDDLYISIEEPMVDSYLKVFRGIFEKSMHGAHYRMMMGDDLVDDISARSDFTNNCEGTVSK